MEGSEQKNPAGNPSQVLGRDYRHVLLEMVAQLVQTITVGGVNASLNSATVTGLALELPL